MIILGYGCEFRRARTSFLAQLVSREKLQARRPEVYRKPSILLGVRKQFGFCQAASI